MMHVIIYKSSDLVLIVHLYWTGLVLDDLHSLVDRS